MNPDELHSELRVLAALVVLSNVLDEAEAHAARVQSLQVAADVLSDEDALEPVDGEPGMRRNPRTGERFYSSRWLS